MPWATVRGVRPRRDVRTGPVRGGVTRGPASTQPASMSPRLARGQLSAACACVRPASGRCHGKGPGHPRVTGGQLPVTGTQSLSLSPRRRSRRPNRDCRPRRPDVPRPTGTARELEWPRRASEKQRRSDASATVELGWDCRCWQPEPRLLACSWIRSAPSHHPAVERRSEL